MKRNTHFSFERRLGRDYWRDGTDENGVERLYGNVFAHWTAEVVSADGAHYHFWVDPTLSGDELKNKLEACERCARMIGDPVRFSYDFIPSKES